MGAPTGNMDIILISRPPGQPLGFPGGFFILQTDKVYFSVAFVLRYLQMKGVFYADVIT